MCFSMNLVTCKRFFFALAIGLACATLPTAAEEPNPVPEGAKPVPEGAKPVAEGADPFAERAKPESNEAEACDGTGSTGAPTSSIDFLVKKLNESTEIDFFEVPLSEVLQEFGDRHDVTILLDERALADQGLDATDLVVTKSVSGASLRTGLSVILADYDLELGARGNILVVTNKEVSPMRTQTYSVDGLVHPSDDCGLLIETILETVVPESWSAVGSQGTAVEYQRQLCVRQTLAVHLELTDLLETLRAKIKLTGGPTMAPKRPATAVGYRVNSTTSVARPARSSAVTPNATRWRPDVPGGAGRVPTDVQRSSHRPPADFSPESVRRNKSPAAYIPVP